MKKYIIFTLIFLSIISNIYSQDALKILSYDYTNYPIIENKVFVFNNLGIPVTNLDKTNFVVRNNGENIKNISTYHCPNPQKIDSSSLTIVFDLGLNNTFHNPSNFNLGIQTANRLINFLDSLTTEISLTSFDYRSFLNSEFTFDKSRIRNELIKYQAAQGSLFDAAFIEEPAGAFKINSRGKYDKSIILITDCAGKYDENALIQQLAQSNAKIFIIAIRKPELEALKNVVASSNGWIFNIEKASDINSVIYSVVAMTRGYEPCTISYELDYSCIDINSIEVLLPSKNIQDDYSFNFNNFGKSTILSNPQSLAFKAVEVGKKKQLGLTITAINRDIFIKELLIKKPFSIVSGNVTNYLLQKDASINLTVEYNPEKRDIVFSQLEIVSDACTTEPIYITGGFPNTKLNDSTKTVRIIKPEENDYLIIGDTTSVKWIGLLKEDVVQLEYSIDDGKTWLPLAKNVMGLNKEWIVPDTPSDSCRVRIIQLWPNNVGFTLDLKHRSDVNSAFFNPAGDLVLTASNDTTAVVWVSNTGAKKFTLKAHHKPVTWAVFDPLDEYIATSSQDSTVIIWSQKDGSIVKVIDVFTAKLQSVNFSRTGQYLVTSDYSGYSYIINRQWQVEKIIKSNDYGPSWYSEFSPVNEDLILSSNGDGKAKEWNWRNFTMGDKPDRVFNTESIMCYNATYNTNATKISATTSSGNPKKLYVWDVSNPSKTDYFLQDTLYSISHNSDTSDNNSINYSSFFFDPSLGKEVFLTSSTDETARLWDAATGKPERINVFITNNILSEHRNSVSTAVSDKFGTRVLTASWDSTAKIWNRDQNELQTDTSKRFTIAYAKGRGMNISMGTVYLGELKDSIIPAVFINESNFAYQILNFKFSGVNKSDFELLTNLKLPMTVQAGESIPLEIRFLPSATGLRSAELEFNLPAGVVVKSSISGFCDLADLKINYPIVDYGKVEVGSFKDSTFNIIMTNTSGQNIELDDFQVVGSYKTEFRAVQNVSKILAPGESIPVTIRLTPINNGRKNAQYIVSYKGKASPRLVNLFGEGIGGKADSLMIYIKDVEAYPGDIFQLPIYVGSFGTFSSTDLITGFTTNMRFNATLLEPLSGFTKTEIIGGERYLSIDLPKEIPSDSIIHTLQFKALWGNDTISPLILEYTIPRGNGKIDIIENSATFKLKGICTQDGKPRFFLPGGGLALYQNIPNPAVNKTNIAISIIENGKTSLSIYDLLGNKVLNVVNQNLSRGDYNFDVDVSNLSPGIYYYCLKTPSDILYNKMIITK